MTKILLAEDDKVIGEGLTSALISEKYEVDWAQNGEIALSLFNEVQHDLCIFDIMMPKINGFDLIQRVRRSNKEVPILVLSARTLSQDKVLGFDIGADDYITKPFDLDEVLARIRRYLRKKMGERKCFSVFEYDWEKRCLFAKESGNSSNQVEQPNLIEDLEVNLKRVELKTKEMLLLEYFLKHENQLVGRDQILDAVWGTDYFGTDRTVDNLILSLRKIVGSDLVQTERGLGYRFVTQP